MPDLLNLGTRVNPEGAQTGLRAVRQSFDRTERHIRGHSDRSARHFNRVERSIQMAQRAIVALGGVVALRAMGRLVTSSIQAADAIEKISTRIGVSTTLLQEWQFAAAQAAGVTENTANMALQRFSRRVAEAAEGSGELLSTLEKYGISVRDAGGHMRGMRELLGDLAEAIQNAESEQEQLRIAFKAFDSEGAALINVLKDGAEGFDRLGDRAHAAGVILSDQMLEDAAEAKSALDELGAATDALSNRLTLTLAPAIRDIAVALGELAGIDPSVRTSTDQELMRRAVSLREQLEKAERDYQDLLALERSPQGGPRAAHMQEVASRMQELQYRVNLVEGELLRRAQEDVGGRARGDVGARDDSPSDKKAAELLGMLSSGGFMVGATGEPGDLGGGFTERSRQAAVAEARAAIAAYERIRAAAEAIRSEAVDAELELRRRRRELFGEISPEAEEARRQGELLQIGRGAMAGIEGGFEAHQGLGVLSSFADEVINNTRTIEENSDRWNEAGRIVLDFADGVRDATRRLGDLALDVGERLLGRMGTAGGIAQAGMQGFKQGGAQGAAAAALAEFIASSETFRKWVGQLDRIVDLAQQVFEPLRPVLTELSVALEGLVRLQAAWIKPLIEVFSRTVGPILQSLNHLFAQFLGFFGISVNREALEAAQAVTEPEVVELRLDASVAMQELQRARDQLLASGSDMERELARQRFLAARETAILAEQRARGEQPGETPLPELEGNLFASVGEFVQRILGQVTEWMHHVLGQFATLVQGVLDPAMDALSHALDQVGAGLSHVGGQALDLVQQALGAVGELATAIGQGVRDALREAFESVGDLARSVGQQVLDGIRDALSGLQNILRNAFDVHFNLPGGGRGTIEKALGINFPWVSFGSGGVVPGTGTQDTVPSMLTPGEVVLSREQVRALQGAQPMFWPPGGGGGGGCPPWVPPHLCPGGGGGLGGGGGGSAADWLDRIRDTIENIADASTGDLWDAVEDVWRDIVRNNRDDLLGRVGNAAGFARGTNLTRGGLGYLHDMEAVLPRHMNPASPAFDPEAFWRPAVAALANMAPAGGGGDGASTVVIVVDDQGREVRRSNDPGEFARGQLLPGLRWAERNGYTDRVTRQ